MSEHGTPARAQKHYRDGEELCEPCRDAKRAHNRTNPKPSAERQAAKAQHGREYYAALMELRQPPPKRIPTHPQRHQE